MAVFMKMRPMTFCPALIAGGIKKSKDQQDTEVKMLRKQIKNSKPIPALGFGNKERRKELSAVIKKLERELANV